MNAIYLYRIAHFLAKSRVPIIPGLLRSLIFFLYNSAIPAQCVIGRGTLFAHGGIGVVLHPDCKIGERVMIGQGVTIGGTFGSGAPIVGSDVWIGPGVRILGDVTIGRNSIIGANAVVVRDVPDNSVVGGVPAKLIRTIEPGALDVLEGRLRNSR
jgi:serine O-acetyltransferase